MTQWISLHVHRYGRQDEFLVDGLAPAVAALREAAAVSNFFFLRYWQGGHHIRVRLRVADTDAAAVAGELTAKLRAYLEEYPSGTELDVEEFHEAQPTMAALEGEEVGEVHPDGTIRIAEYRPEYHKYGGAAGVAIAEEFFGASSRIVLDALRDPRDNPNRRLGTGFSTMLRGLTAAGLPASDMAAFFAHYCLLWSPYLFDRFLVTWPALLRVRRAPVLSHVDTLLGGRELTDPVSRAVGQAMARLTPEILPHITIAGPDAPRPRRRQVLLVSYLHTHNNRLGLIPEQEAFLGYLGHHVLSEYAGIAPEADLMRRIEDTRARRLNPHGQPGGTTWT